MKNNLKTPLIAYLVSGLLSISLNLHSQTFISKSVGSNVLLQGIDMYTETEGYMCADNGIVYKLNADNSTTPLFPQVSQSLFRISTIPDTRGNGFVSVGSNSTIIKTLDKGQSFTQLNINQPFTSVLFGITCLDSTTYYTCGGIAGIQKSTVLRTSDGGLNWYHSVIDSSIFLENLIFTDEKNGFAVGPGLTPASGRVYKTNDSGKTWKSVLKTQLPLTNIFSLNKDTLIVIGPRNIYKSYNDGLNWHNKYTIQKGLYGIDFINANEGYVCGVGAGSTSFMLKTLNGGETWDSLSIPNIGPLLYLKATSKKIVASSLAGNFIVAQTSLNTKFGKRNHTTIYPNPSNGFFSVSSENRIKEVCIYDKIGSMIYSSKYNSTNVRLALSKITAGVYLVMVKDINNNISYEKVVISN